MSLYFLHNSYGLFLFLFRGQPNNLQLPSHKLIWSTVLPSTTQNLWCPTCLLDLKKFRRTLKTQIQLAFVPTLSPFRGLFKDYKPPLYLHSDRSRVSVKLLILQRTLFSVENCFSSGGRNRTGRATCVTLGYEPSEFDLYSTPRYIFILFISILFYKDKYFILIYQIFFNFFCSR